jgi:anthranilate 1,2-dioxygenase small subunit
MSASAALDLAVRLELYELQNRYAEVLDDDALEAWPDLFVEDCLYEIIPKENVEAGLPAPLIWCDSRRMLRDRVVSLRNANIFQPAVYRHFLSATILTPVDADTVDMRSNYMVVNTSQAGESVIYQAGRYFDRVVRTGEGWRFKSKRAVYDTSRVQTLLAIPV